MCDNKCSSRGSALFLILIAVALFAALSYALTQSSRGSGSVDKEQAVIAAAQISSFFGEIQQAVMRMQIVNGCADNQISFETTRFVNGSGSVIHPIGGNPNAPLDGRCNVFSAAGGGVTARVMTIGFQGPDPFGATAPGNLWVVTENMPGIGTSAPDLVLGMPQVTDATCRAFNRASGITTDPLTTLDWFSTTYNGTYTTGAANGTEGVIPSGLKSFCSEYLSPATTSVLYVLIER